MTFEFETNQNMFQYNIPQFNDNISEKSCKMNETQKKEYEELARKRNYFLEMMKLMTNKMTQSQSLTPNKLFKNYNDNQNEKNINNTQEINNTNKIITSKTYNNDNHTTKYTTIINKKNNVNNSDKKPIGLSNQNNIFLNSYYRTPNKNDNNTIINNRNSNLSNNKIYSIIDTKDNKKQQQNYDETAKTNKNIVQNTNDFLDDLFDD